MYCSEFFGSTWWWVWPVLMMAMCFFVMRRWRGPMMCGFSPKPKERPQYSTSDSPTDILDKRYAAGAIDKVEYEEMKRSLCDIANTRKDQGA